MNTKQKVKIKKIVVLLLKSKGNAVKQGFLPKKKFIKFFKSNLYESNATYYSASNNYKQQSVYCFKNFNEKI